MQRAIAAVFAHPDDETFAIGGTIARHAGAARCTLFCATNGDAGRSSGVAVSSREALGALRARELAAAARVLGFTSVVAPGYPDGALKSVDADVLVGDIVAFLREHRPDIVITFGPEGAPNTHADHRAISRAATAAFHLAGNPASYPETIDRGLAAFAPRRLFYTTWETPAADAALAMRGLPITARIDVRAQLDANRAAFEAHGTQHQHRERFESLALNNEELYFLAAGVPQPAGVIDDLFAGL